ncbi:MAG TPA: lipid-A-disaccharide synthase [Candidatus Kapabacteria bacterium]|nr:lipid-A-disaccharide synthase [Candidatus Kapabacteria bacterium]
MPAAASAPSERRTIFVVAGEASGDMHAAELVRELRLRVPDLELIGIGSERLAAEGLESLVDASRMNVAGFLEVVRRYRFLRAAFARAVDLARTRRPALAILVDYPGFNLRLARELHTLGIPVAYYIAPQVWAWKEGRVAQLRRYVDELIVAFPFEVAWFAERGVTARFFGHPIVDMLARQSAPASPRPASRRSTITYLPGSRSHEIVRHMPLLTAVMRRLGAQYHHVVPLAPTIERAELEPYLAQASFEIATDAREALGRSDAALVKAGTSTIEAALAGVPFAAYYRTSRVSYEIARRFITVPWIAMVNILAGRGIVREFIQEQAEPEAMADELQRIVEDGAYRATMIAELVAVRTALGEPGAAARVAEFIVGRFLR